MEYLEDRTLLSAWVTTDRDDYAPGETVQIIGGGFAVGETIELIVLRTDGVEDSPPGNLPWRVTDGGIGDLDGLTDGNIQTTWYVEAQYASASLELFARGLSSGEVASTTFTDSDLTSVTVTPRAPIRVAAGGVQKPSYQISVASAGLPVTPVNDVDLSIVFATAGVATGSFSPSTVDIPNPSTPAQSTLAVTPGAATAVGDYAFTVTAKKGAAERSAPGTLRIGLGTTLVVTATDGVFGGTTTLTATLTATATPIVGREVRLYLNTETSPVAIGMTGPDGRFQSDVQLAGLDAGSHTVSARFEGDLAYSTPTTTFAASMDTATLSIARRAITVTAAAATKQYDGNATSTVAPTITDGSLVAGDTANFNQRYNDKHVGVNKVLTPAGSVNDGNGGNNYDVTFVSMAVGTITIRPLTVTATAQNKVYDGTRPATVTLIGNGVPGDMLTIDYGTANFADKDVGTAKSVTVTGISISDSDASNYDLSNLTATTTANISRRTLTVTATAQNKAYDGTTTATVTFADDRVAGDALTVDFAAANFADKNVGIGKTVTVTGITISGGDASNYTVNATATTTANINPASTALVAGIVVANKIYDGTPAATITSYTLAGLLNVSDDVQVVGGAANFVDKNVGNAKSVTATGLRLTGSDAGNYTVNATATTSANIARRALTVTATAQNKVYDGATTATVTIADDRVAGDALTVDFAAANFADKNVGIGKTVTVTGITISGGDASNYTVNATATTTANIARRTLTVTADTKAKTFGQADPPLTFTSTPLVPGDTFSGGLVRDPGEDAGTYSIRRGTLSAGANYDLTFVESSLTIQAAASRVTVQRDQDSYFAVHVTFYATITIDTGMITGGKVTFRDQAGGELGVDLSLAVAPGGKTATASIEYSRLPIGTHTILASFDGDPNVSPSSASVGHRVLPYVVTNASDIDTASALEQTFREVIVQANRADPTVLTPNSPFNAITFAFAGAPSTTILLGSSLDTIQVRGLRIDAGRNLLAPVVILSGANAGAGASGLVVAAPDVTIQGLGIRNFSGSGIVLQSSGARVLGNFLGNDDAPGARNARYGLEIDGGANNRIGGTAAGDRNIISDNTLGGIHITGEGATGNLVQGNLIGTKGDGLTALGNGGPGVLIDGGASRNTIGGPAAGAANVLANNTYGVQVVGVASLGNTASANSITANAIQGIDNPETFGGIAEVRNAYFERNATLDPAIHFERGRTRVAGNLTGIPGEVYDLEFFINEIGDDLSVETQRRDSQGKAYLKVLQDNSLLPSLRVIIPASGVAEFIAELPATAAIPSTLNGFLTTTATLRASNAAPERVGTTSEFSLFQFVTTKFTVTITDADASAISKPGSLAFVIDQINNDPIESGSNPVVIPLAFRIERPGEAIINPEIALPHLTRAVDIDGLNTYRFSQQPVLIQRAGGDFDGLVFTTGTKIDTAGNTVQTTSSGSTIRRIALSGFEDAIELRTDRNTVTATTLGVRASNRGAGIHVVGGSENVLVANILGNNLAAGILVEGATANGNLIRNNLVGTDGVSRFANGVGIQVGLGASNTTIGGASESDRNLISGNTGAGVVLTSGARETVIAGNLIGTNLDGTSALGNGGPGVLVDGAAMNVIGGGNLIAGHATRAGVEITGGSIGNRILGNLIGTDRAGTLALPNKFGVEITGMAATGNTVGGDAGLGLGNLIGGNVDAGVKIADGAALNKVQGNLIGTNATGGAMLGNGAGVVIDSAPRNTIGGMAGQPGSGAGNVIAGNSGAGVEIRGATSRTNDVQGNLIGLRPGGITQLANAVGVRVVGASDNSIGGSTAAPGTGPGNLISGNTGAGVEIQVGSTGNQILGNLIGTDISGNNPLANATGVLLLRGASGNVVGGEGSGTRNIISGNSGTGVRIEGANSTTVRGNSIGTNAAGLAPIGNSASGIEVTNVIAVAVDGSDAVVLRGNLISGNARDGILARNSTGVRILGNAVGLGIDGLSIVPNGSQNDRTTGNGIKLDGTTNVLVGLPDGSADARNIISSNRAAGILITGGSTGTKVLGNSIGTDSDGRLARGNDQGGVLIDGSSDKISSDNTIGGATVQARNLISGNLGAGVEIGAHSIRTQILGNYIGTDADGMTPLANRGNGVRISGASGNTIGGTTVQAGTGLGNLISGNGLAGILIDGSAATGNLVFGNAIGTNSSGSASLPNRAGGVQVVAAPGNTVGGLTTTSGTGLGNLISGNGQAGVLIDGVGATGNIVLGNAIGTNGDLKSSLPNLSAGVEIRSASGNTIGGSSDQAGNTIAGNVGAGIRIVDVQLTRESERGNRIEGNRIGVSVGGRFGNGGDGVLVERVSTSSGGDAVVLQGNVILLNAGHGIQVGDSSGVRVEDNLVGTDGGGVAGLGNRRDGVLMINVTGNTAIVNNEIAGNGAHGVEITGGSTGAEVSQNVVRGNNGEGVVISGGISNTLRSNTILGNRSNGVRLTGAPSITNTIVSNHIAGSGINGIQIDDEATRNTIRQNLIGQARPDAASDENAGSGILISQASSNAVSGNVVQGNRGDGVLISEAAGNVLTTNLIADNGNAGVSLISASKFIADGKTVEEGNQILANLIADNGSFGVLVSNGSSGNILRGNTIGVVGTDRLAVFLSGKGDARFAEVASERRDGNSSYGVFVLDSPSNTISDNEIGGNESHGILLLGPSTSNTVVSENFIGTDRKLRDDRGNSGNGVLVLDAGANTIAFNKVAANKQSGIVLLGTRQQAHSNKVLGNEVGRGQAGAPGNFESGIIIFNAFWNEVAWNIVDGNAQHGVSLTGNWALGNTIGPNISISANRGDGIRVENAPWNVIRHNSIAANLANGIELVGAGTRGTQVAENRIVENLGTGIQVSTAPSNAFAGNRILGNAGAGVRVSGAPGNRIGAGSSGIWNTIDGNRGIGIEIVGNSSGTVVHGNQIGWSNPGGVARAGVQLQSIGILLNNTNGVTVGGAEGTAPANVISGNAGHGIFVEGGHDNRVVGNFVGLDSSGTDFVGNGATGVGIRIRNSTGNVIGGTVISTRNTISGHGLTGILVEGRDARYNQIQNNAIGTDRDARPPDKLRTREEEFHEDNVQPRGILINGAILNLVGPGNVFRGNAVGVEITGDTTFTLPAGGSQTALDDRFGPTSNVVMTGTNAIAGRNTFEQNLIGVLLNSSTRTDVIDNDINRNIGIGVAIVGELATSNRVVKNRINLNGGVSSAPPGSYGSRDIPQLGTGVYIDAARNNLVGGWLGDSPDSGNEISGNALAGIYIYNRADNNRVGRNRIMPAENIRGYYGVLVYNARGNVDEVLRNSNSRARNQITAGEIATFREFTGQVLERVPLLQIPALPQTNQIAPQAVPQGPAPLWAAGSAGARRPR